MAELICRKCCKEIGYSLWAWHSHQTSNNACYKCGNILSEIELTRKELRILYDISKEDAFIDAMANLKSKDIIEFNLKFAQFEAQSKQNFNDRRNQALKEKQIKENSVTMQNTHPVEDNRPKCPKCGGTDFTPVRRKWSFWRGFATNKIDMVCNNCGTVRK